jgi:hypothetical protein
MLAGTYNKRVLRYVNVFFRNSKPSFALGN